MSDIINAAFDFAGSRFLSDVHRIDPETDLPVCGKDYNGKSGEWFSSDNERDIKFAERIGYDLSRVTCAACTRILRGKK